MFTILFTVSLTGAPIEQFVSVASSLGDVLKEAQSFIKNNEIGGYRRYSAEVFYVILDADGVYIGTWLKGEQVDP